MSEGESRRLNTYGLLSLCIVARGTLCLSYTFGISSGRWGGGIGEDSSSHIKR